MWISASLSLGDVMPMRGDLPVEFRPIHPRIEHLHTVSNREGFKPNERAWAQIRRSKSTTLLRLHGVRIRIAHVFANSQNVVGAWLGGAHWPHSLR